MPSIDHDVPRSGGGVQLDSPPTPVSEDTSPRPPHKGKARRQPTPGLFRAFWRWHFYASIIVIPIFALLAVTGLVILFKWQIDPAFNPGVLTTTQPAFGTKVTASQQEAAVLAKYPGATITFAQFGSDDRTTAFTIETDDGEQNVYVDPWTAAVTGAIDPRSLPSNIATEIHGKIIFGTISDVALFDDPVTGEEFTTGSIGDRIIELAACWAIVMTLTGYYLFFRGRSARRRRIAASAKGALTRNRHGWVGAIAGVWILLLVASGLPWTGLWGSKVQGLATGTNFSLWGEDPGASSTLGAAREEAGNTSAPAPGAQGAAPLPTSAHAGGVEARVSLDAIVATATADGLPQPLAILYPSAEDGVFSVMSDMWHDPGSPAWADTTRERVVHVDQYSGDVAGRYSYDEYSPTAKAVSQMISMHEGQRFGSLNFVASALFCVAILFLCVTGPLMWWRRRPKGGFGAPEGRMPLRGTWWLLAAVVALGIFMPLLGASLLVVLLIDNVVTRRSTSPLGSPDS